MPLEWQVEAVHVSSDNWNILYTQSIMITKLHFTHEIIYVIGNQKNNYNTALYLDLIFGDLFLKNNIVMAYNLGNEFCFRQLPCLAVSVIKSVTTSLLSFSVTSTTIKKDSSMGKKANRNKIFHVSSIL